MEATDDVRGTRPKLRVTLLGNFALSLDNKPIMTLGSPKLQALLAYLLLRRNAPQSRRHLAFLFWPNSSEAQALTNLRKVLTDLRKALPDATLRVSFDHNTIQWRSDPSIPFELDVDNFEEAFTNAQRLFNTFSTGMQEFDPALVESLQRAVDLYTGELLPSCYDEWILTPREQLREKLLIALDNLIALLERSGYLPQSIMYARRLLRHEPLLEENYRRLMRLYMDSGDRTGALNVYKQCALMLKREYGIEPGQSTLAILNEAAPVDRDDVPSPAPAGLHQPTGANLNIPAQTTTFFGREKELAELSTLLRVEQIRLVTLTGTPGTGKTRLSMQAAASLAPAFPDGVSFVPLAAIAEPDEARVLGAIASALELADAGGSDLRSVLKKSLQGKQSLLVLDNFEHLLATASVVSDLLAACPRLKVLCTSRAPLNLRGEHEFLVPSLPLPPGDTPARLEDLVQYESVALFIDRALEVSPRFDLTPLNLRAIADICRRLEGLPLSIELAAARVKAHSPRAILERLDRRLKLLVGGRRDVPTRHQTLNAAITWSYNLLDEVEKSMFRMLGVFVGGFSPQAVEAVASDIDPAQCLQTLTSLLDNSLLTRMDGADAEPRFDMLETLREYARERLVERGQEHDIARRHALYFLKLAETSAREHNGPREQAWTDKLDHEHDNLRAALHWSIDVDDAEVALRLSGALGLFWERRGYLSEGRRWISRALQLQSGDGSRYRADALYYGGLLALRQRDYADAQSSLRQSRMAFQGRGDKAGESNALSALAIMTLDSDYEAAIELHLQSLQLRRELGDKAGIARTLQNLGFIKMHQGVWHEASSLTEEAHALYRELESRQGIAFTLYVLAMVAAEQGNHKLAHTRFEECLVISREIRNSWLTAWALDGLGNFYFRTGRYDEANRAFTEAGDLFRELGDKLGMAHALVVRAREAQRLHDYEGASRLYNDAQALGLELENNGVIASCIAGFAGLAAVAGRYPEAAALFGSAEKLLNTLYTSIEREQITLGLAETRSALGDDAWQAAWAEGEAMSTHEALALAQTIA